MVARPYETSSGGTTTSSGEMGDKAEVGLAFDLSGAPGSTRSVRSELTVGTMMVVSCAGGFGFNEMLLGFIDEGRKQRYTNFGQT
jgi:hypothetical protein